MGESNSLMNVGDLAKPATVLIEKISEAIGGIFKPYQIRRVAQAEADAEKIEAAAKIEVTELSDARWPDSLQRKRKSRAT